MPIASAQRVAIPNVGYNRISVHNDGWNVDVWADTSHLVIETLEGV